MQRHTYVKIWARSYRGLIMMSSILDAWTIKGLPERLTGSAQNILAVPEGKLQALYFDSIEWEVLKKTFYRRVSSSSFRTREHVLQYHNELKHFLKFAKQLGASSGGLTRRNAKKIFRKYLFEWFKFSFYLWYVFLFDHAIEPEIEKRLKNMHLPEPRRSTLLKLANTQTVTTKTKELHRLLIRLALLYRHKRITRSTLRTRLVRITKDFEWLSLYDYTDKPYRVNHFETIFKKYNRMTALRLRAEHNALAINAKKGNLEFRQNLKYVSHDPLLHKFLLLLHEYVNLKDIRDDYRRQSYRYVHIFFKAYAGVYGIKKHDMDYLTYNEVLKLSPGRLPISRAILEKRKKAYMMYLDNGKLIVYQGTDIARARERLLGSPKEFAAESVKGNTAYPGRILGIVRVIETYHEFGKFKRGDILVTTMTHPEFLPVMKLARAIITDEGGMTCHAAIVAREMHKPCIIGTKIATQVLKDGDRVEVDANKGIVRILKPVSSKK